MKAAALDETRPRGSLFRFEGWTRFVPLLLCGGFYVGTIAWTAVGPLNWHLSNPVRTYSYLIAAAIALAGGYLLATLPHHHHTDAVAPDGWRGTLRQWLVRPSALLIAASVVSLLLLPFTSHASTGDWLPNVWRGIVDPATAYRSNKRFDQEGSPLVLYIRMLCGPLLLLIFPLTTFGWHTVSKVARGFGIASIVGTISLYVAQGINKGMADLVAYTVLFLTLLAASQTGAGRWKRRVGCLLAALTAFGLFFAFYSNNIASRVAADERENAQKEQRVENKDIDDTLVQQGTMNFATERGGVYSALPDPVMARGVMLTRYLTHGYKGLDLAMNHSWTPTYGLGTSIFVRHNVLKVIGKAELEPDIEARTYAGKISAQDEWPVGNYWASFFIHPASDITFAGTLALMVLIGFAFGASWRDGLTREDPLAIAVFFWLCILVFYLPANNQLGQGGESAIGFGALLTGWLLLRRWRVRPEAANDEVAPA